MNPIFSPAMGKPYQYNSSKIKFPNEGVYAIK